MATERIAVVFRQPAEVEFVASRSSRSLQYDSAGRFGSVADGKPALSTESIEPVPRGGEAGMMKHVADLLGSRWTSK